MTCRRLADAPDSHDAVLGALNVLRYLRPF